MTNRASLLATVLLVSALPAWAAEQLLPGHSLDMRVSGSYQRTTFVVLNATFPTAGGPDDPRNAGAIFEILAQSGEVATLVMPAAGWTANSAGTKYRFRSPSAAQVRLVQKGSTLKVQVWATGITLDEPSQASIGLLLATGTTHYCMLFGGTIVHDQPNRFIARRSDAPLACPTPVCGNGIIELGEECDTPGSSCGAGGTCQSDCTCPCDFLDPSLCMYPFPNDWFTVPDPTKDTGKRVNFSLAGMPANASSVVMNPVPYAGNDGFSQGASIITRVPNVDLAMTGSAPITDIERSLDTGAPVVLVNANTLAHHLMWVEVDSNATSEPNRVIFVRPAINLDEGGRYIVALRDMKDSSGAILTPNADFLAYRDNTPTGEPVKEARRAHMEDIFTTLAAAGVPRANLYLAWDFTVASKRNITERLLFARDDAFSRLGAAAPTFTVMTVDNSFDPGRIYRRVRGTYQVERYVDTISPGAKMVLDANGLPIHQATTQPASFDCIIPEAALLNAGATAVPARASIYGHGLLGSASEVTSGNVRDMANEHNFVFCATDWIGMSNADIGNAVGILQELGKFPSLTDRLQQAMVDQLFLARLMIHPNGFASDPAFKDLLGNSVIDPSAVFYDGNSQGGIYGGTVMAIAQDITRGVLGVPGMNYSTLLQRSTDFATYGAILYPAYPNELVRPLLFGLIQMLWDRSDPSGLAKHITNDPLPGTPSHQVLLHLAFGDHQVSNVTTEIEARTIGASIHTPAIAGGRHSDVNPYFGIPAIPSYPFNGSALIVWDSAAATPPITNTAPVGGFDPHSHPRNSVIGRNQKSDFLKTGGNVIDVCSGAPCVP